MINLENINNDIKNLLNSGFTYDNCKQLAILYSIRDHINEPKMATKEPIKTITSNNTSDFLKAVNGKNTTAVWDIIDELMEAVKVLHPKMYNKVIEKLNEI